ncbi:lytic murein transglycosylase [Nocardioides sp. WS12]|uniref:lytic murein transglycosylase n=1 Tax=Nocardioides sp. WS12 TaxID=2486272 RepID=UPI0023517B0D|nr:lytic murein transglycosylase [Nocardioides sp. WS12]
MIPQPDVIVRGAGRARPSRRLVALVPLGALSLAWTLSVAGAGAGVVPLAAERDEALPAVAVPDQSVDVPASLSSDSRVVERPVRIATVAATSSQIPAVALASYQRAATVMAAADESCGIAWPVLAAIGKVESDHASTGNSVLQDDGVAKPGIIGVRLDGSRSTAQISDTDGGRYDGDKSFDRAVGPMQFIPSTWGVVGVDADGDGQRNPQDIDDAALAAAVYLCSGTGDLSTPAGLRPALLRYNNSGLYAETVLAIADSYANSGPLPVSAGVAVVSHGSIGARAPHSTTSRKQARKAAAKAAPAPVSPSGTGGNTGTGSGSGGGTGGGSSTPEAPVPGPPLKPVDQLLDAAETLVHCTLDGIAGLLNPSAPTTCKAP